LLLLAVLFPIAVYLGVLGWINRRPRGLLVSGPWDFAGILFAASGFLLLGGPALLSSLTQTDAWRNFWVMAKRSPNDNLHESLIFGRVVLFGVYFVIVVGVSALLLRRRRRLTAIYNVDPALVETVLGETFERWQLPFVQTGNVLLIDPNLGGLSSRLAPAQEGTPPVSAPSELVEKVTTWGKRHWQVPDGTPASAPSVLVEKVTTLEVEASIGMCHVTLLWDPPDSLLRREIEGQLRRALSQRHAPPGTVGDWLLLASSILFFLLLVGAGVLVLLRFIKR
jgi:hypothetical protein